MEIKSMSFEQFVSWATGHILFGIGAGQTLNVLVWEILDAFVLSWLPAHGWKKG